MKREAFDVRLEAKKAHSGRFLRTSSSAEGTPQPPQLFEVTCSNGFIDDLPVEKKDHLRKKLAI